MMFLLSWNLVWVLGPLVLLAGLFLAGRNFLKDLIITPLFNLGWKFVTGYLPKILKASPETIAKDKQQAREGLDGTHPHRPG